MLALVTSPPHRGRGLVVANEVVVETLTTQDALDLVFTVLWCHEHDHFSGSADADVQAAPLFSVRSVLLVVEHMCAVHGQLGQRRFPGLGFLHLDTVVVEMQERLKTSTAGYFDITAQLQAGCQSTRQSARRVYQLEYVAGVGAPGASLGSTAGGRDSLRRKNRVAAEGHHGTCHRRAPAARDRRPDRRPGQSLLP
jgi:hypothetical protein